jgi:hypothetical protein
MTHSRIAHSRNTFIGITPSRMTLSRKKHNKNENLPNDFKCNDTTECHSVKTTISKMTHNRMAYSRMTLSRMTLSRKGHNKNETLQNDIK